VTIDGARGSWSVVGWADGWYEIRHVPQGCGEPMFVVVTLPTRAEALAWYLDRAAPGSTLGHIDPEEEADAWRTARS
jgi:hypothetical protein